MSYDNRVTATTAAFIPYGQHYIDEDDIQAVVNVLRSGRLTQGPLVEEFEKAAAEFVGAKFAIAVSSGTAALHLAYLAAGVQPGDRVITTPNTFVATANAAFYVGAKPEFADIDSETLNIDPAALDLKCHELKVVKAVIPVHFAGVACDMPRIHEIAKNFGGVVIEDACHAFGGRYPDDGRIGNCAYSDMTVFSFHPVKSIAAGEGGMITTNNQELYRRLIRLRSHGINKGNDVLMKTTCAYDGDRVNPWYYEMQELGFNYRITDIQCALALSQMDKLERFVSRRREIACVYDEAFLGFRDLKPVQKPYRDFSAHHLYVLRIDFGAIGMSRQMLMRRLYTKGIGTQVHYIPVPTHPYYERLGFDIQDYPQTKKYYEQALTIPMYYRLTDEEICHVISAFAELTSH